MTAKPQDPAAWMRTYYQNARRVYQSSGRALEQVEAHDASLLRQFRDWRSRLSTPEFTISRERVFLRNPAEILSSAQAVLRLFTFSARHGLKLSWDAQRRLRSSAETLRDEFRSGRLPWEAWHDLFAQPEAAVALADMQETGILAAAIPEWESVDGLVVRDFYHRYTVDEHTLVAIGIIDSLATPKAHLPQRFQTSLARSRIPRWFVWPVTPRFGEGNAPGYHVAGSLACASHFGSLAWARPPKHKRSFGS